MNEVEFFFYLTRVFGSLQFDHTTMEMPESFFKDKLWKNQFFPLPLKFIDGEAYNNYDKAEIPVGAKILTINGITIDEILTKYDQKNKEERAKESNFRDLENYFTMYYYLLYQGKEYFDITYTIPNNENNKEYYEHFLKQNNNQSIASIRLNAINSRAFNGRNSTNFYLSDKKQYKENLFYQYFDELKTMYIALNSFNADENKFTEVFNYLAQQYSQLKSNYLILDLRENTGGNMNLGAKLYSYFASKKYIDEIKGEVRTLNVLYPEQLLSINQFPKTEQLVKDVNAQLKEKFNETLENGVYKSKPNFLTNEIIPNQYQFKGKIFVLVSGSTYSTAVSFCRYLYNDAGIDVTFVGEETGSSYYGHTANYLLDYKLPHTQLVLQIPAVNAIFPTIKKDFPPKSGLIPQHKVTLKYEDFISQKDTVLDYVTNLIYKK